MITLDGNTEASFGLIVQPGHDHGTPQTVDRFVAIPKRHGVYDFGADIGPREFAIPMSWAKEISTSDLQAKIRTFAAFLVNVQGRPRDRALRFDYEPDKYYTVRYSGQIPIDRLLSMGFFTLPLIAVDPFAYGEEQILETTITTSPHSEIVETNGTIETPPIITLTNTGGATINGFTITAEIEVD